MTIEISQKYRDTKSWLQQTIAELEHERDVIPGYLNEDAAMALKVMKLAMAAIGSEQKVNNHPAHGPVSFYEFSLNDNDYYLLICWKLRCTFLLYAYTSVYTYSIFIVYDKRSL